MIKIEELEDEVERLIQGKCCYSNIEKLAMLYTVIEHMKMGDDRESVAKIPRG